MRVEMCFLESYNVVFGGERAHVGGNVVFARHLARGCGVGRGGVEIIGAD
jgi:hypothetical protein